MSEWFGGKQFRKPLWQLQLHGRSIAGSMAGFTDALYWLLALAEAVPTGSSCSRLNEKRTRRWMNPQDYETEEAQDAQEAAGELVRRESSRSADHPLFTADRIPICDS